MNGTEAPSLAADRARGRNHLLMLGPVLSVTVGVPDLAVATAAYRRLLDLEVRAEGVVGEALAAAWGAPAVVVSSWTLLGRPGADGGQIRLLELRDAESPEPFRTLGWAALEVLVADADAALERCRSEPAFEVLVPPAPVGGDSRLRALQVRGPGGEGLYLTEIRASLPGFRLPSLTTGEGRVYAVVAACANLTQSRDWFADRFALTQVTDHGLPVRVLNRAFGLAEGTLHRVSSLQLDGEALLELDQYPADASARPCAGGGLPGGLNLVSFAGRAGSVLSGPGGLDFEVIRCQSEERS